MKNPKTIAGAHHPETERSDSDDRLIFLIARAQHRLQTHLKNQLQAEGVRITPVQAGILFLLKQKNGRPMNEVSQALRTDNSAVTGLADRLEKAGFIERKPSPRDRRISLLHITPEGLEEVDRAKAVIRRVNAAIKDGFSEEELNAFKRVLNAFFDKFP